MSRSGRKRFFMPNDLQKAIRDSQKEIKRRQMRENGARRVLKEKTGVSPYRGQKHDTAQIYASEKQLCRIFGISKATAYRKVRAMKQDNSKDIITDGRFVRVRVEGFREYVDKGNMEVQA